ncbi:hypothetical protein ACJX0J_021520, partial [Zea mays]
IPTPQEVPLAAPIVEISFLFVDWHMLGITEEDDKDEIMKAVIEPPLSFQNYLLQAMFFKSLRVIDHNICIVCIQTHDRL